jgi:hypothetical protein
MCCINTSPAHVSSSITDIYKFYCFYGPMLWHISWWYVSGIATFMSWLHCHLIHRTESLLVKSVVTSIPHLRMWRPQAQRFFNFSTFMEQWCHIYHGGMYQALEHSWVGCRAMWFVALKVWLQFNMDLECSESIYDTAFLWPYTYNYNWATPSALVLGFFWVERNQTTK